MTKIDSLNLFNINLSEGPLVQALTVALTSYIGLKISGVFSKENNCYLNYFGKSIAGVASLGTLYFAGLFSEPFFINRLSFKIVSFGPIDCGTSLEDLHKVFSRYFLL